MDIEKLLTEYVALKWELQEAKENPQPIQDKLAALKTQLDNEGVQGEAFFSHDRCGGMVVGLKSDEPMYLCVHCHRRGDINVRYDHDFSGYATFVGDVEY